MGLGRLNPGCRDECGCEGCFGGIQVVGNCEIRWTTTGDPFAVELLRDGALVSASESGAIYAPESGTYTLRIRCAESDGWSVVDSVVFTAQVEPACFSCCRTAGQPFNQFDTALAEVSLSGSLWAAFNGAYVLQKTTPCFPFQVCTYSTLRCSGPSVGAWPLGQPGDFVRRNPVTGQCQKIPDANLYRNGTYIATFTESFAFPSGTVVFEVWALPRSFSAYVYHGDSQYFDGDPLRITGPRRQRMEMQAEIAIYEVAVSGSPPLRCHNIGLTTDKFWRATATNPSLPCGNTTLSAPGNAFIQFIGDFGARYPTIPPTSMQMSLFT